MSRPAIFLDRDGTVIREDGWVTDPDQVRLIPGAAQAIIALHERGFAIVLITNQSAVARGLLDITTLDSIHGRLRSLLAAEGASLDAIYYCPHHPEGTVAEYATACRCRKPETGMVEQAARDMDLDLAASFVVGDDLRDLALAKPLGMAAILVRTGKGAAREAEGLVPRDSTLIIDSIADLAAHIGS